ncbi:trypsin-like peptidase domain-containing protein [Actinacidiphila glaucinigra]|uniref:S1C family serine protease n=1 Tax=Actinacidiphila glaucinigra TaxID=235986 RepID=UPI002DD9F56E|nr:trypsin-like peptidase domain-containing protein [Actinacidiphila glaucinigra]WSD62543.1 trypsin-like peptidase domain-containing protein [Actinacidiphila glaucinigra]
MRDSKPNRWRPPAALRAAALLLAVACCGSLAAGCTGDSPSPSAASSAPAPVAASELAGARDLERSYQQVVKAVLPSVVQINTSEGLGSGIVYDTKGHIVTNAHVVGSADTFEVTLANSDTLHKGRLVAAYPEQDLAVIELEDPPSGLRAAAFGRSRDVQVGQIVLAMGSPLGLNSSVTQGIVSAVGRTVSEAGAEGGTGATLADMVQTSAPINPGNSGGALVNLSGQVIGIPTLAALNPTMGDSSAPGIGFAIPAATVTRIADQIIEHGRVVDSGRAALGIAGRTVLDEDFQPAGVGVVEVTRGGAAEKAGIRPGDVITGVGDDDITTLQSLSEALVQHAPGDTVDVTFQRGGAEKTVKVTLGQLQ